MNDKKKIMLVGGGVSELAGILNNSWRSFQLFTDWRDAKTELERNLNDYSLVVIDYNDDARDMVLDIRELEKRYFSRQPLPVFFAVGESAITANALDQYFVNMEKLGIKLLIKPFRPNDANAAINHALISRSPA